jgi:hypothetical protein
MRRNMVELRRMVDLPMPPNVRFHVVMSSAVEDTLIQFLGAKRGVGKPVWGVGKYAGDGTVAAISALGRSAKENVIESKREHQFIYEDDAIWPRLRTILLQ